MERLFVNVLMGLIAGTVCAIGGAIKDTPHEGFKLLTFPRSIIAGLIGGIWSSYFSRDPIFALCFAGYFERVAVEGYKLLRGGWKLPSKFKKRSP